MGSSNEQRVEYGLKNVHYAVITDSGTALTYGTPKKLIGAVDISLNPKGETNPFYADDIEFHSTNSNDGYEGDLTIARITDEFRVDVLGDKIDEKGILVERGDATPKRIALLFEFASDKNAVRHVLYNVSVARPSDSSKTKEGKADPNTQKLTFRAALDPYTQIPKAKSTQSADKTTYDAWYTTVYKTKVVE